MNIKIERFHFITCAATNGISPSETAKQAYEAGCRWVQLRMKGCPEALIETEAAKAMAFANKFGGVLIINDWPGIAKAIGAHGVHLGKDDMPPTRARAILGDNAIIGGTANTIEDIHRLTAEGVNYIGLGPLRFTSTKDRLSPTLGLTGYKKIMESLRLTGFKIPVVAIGGIIQTDVQNLLETGVWGVAVSGAVTGSLNFAGEINRFLNATSNTITKS